MGKSPKVIYNGKSKRVYEVDDDTLLMEFKDEVTAFDGARKDTAKGKGELCAAISAFLFRKIEGEGVRTHLIEYTGSRYMKVVKLRIFPIEVIVRNHAYGSLLKRMPLYRSMERLAKPLVEFHYKDDSLHDPLILEDDIINTGIMDRRQLEMIRSLALTVNGILEKVFASKDLTLIDIKLEFGLDERTGDIVLADELSGDSFRVVDRHGRHYDKEVYRKRGDPEELVKVYRELNSILGIT